MTEVNPVLLEILKAYQSKIEIHTHNDQEVDSVTINLDTNKIIINHEHPYLLNQSPVEIPKLLNDVFRIEKKEGHYNVKLKHHTPDELMDAFQELHDQNKN